MDILTNPVNIHLNLIVALDRDSYCFNGQYGNSELKGKYLDI